MTRKLIAVVSSAALSLLVLYPTLYNGFLSDDFLDLDHRFSSETFTRIEAGGFRPLIVAVWALDSVIWGGGETVHGHRAGTSPTC